MLLLQSCWKSSLWRLGEGWGLRHKPLKMRGFILHLTKRKAQTHSRRVRGRVRGAQERRAGTCSQSTCISGGGIRSIWVIKQWLNLRWKLPVWFWIPVLGTKLCMACRRAVSQGIGGGTLWGSSDSDHSCTNSGGNVDGWMDGCHTRISLHKKVPWVKPEVSSTLEDLLYLSPKLQKANWASSLRTRGALQGLQWALS